MFLLPPSSFSFHARETRISRATLRTLQTRCGAGGRSIAKKINRERYIEGGVSQEFRRSGAEIFRYSAGHASSRRYKIVKRSLLRPLLSPPRALSSLIPGESGEKRPPAPTSPLAHRFLPYVAAKAATRFTGSQLVNSRRRCRGNCASR